MAATRLKYVKTSEGNFTTEGYIQTLLKGPVRAYYNTEAKSWKITSSLGTELIAEGTLTVDKSIDHKLKIAIKKQLLKLGALFHKEKRKKRLESTNVSAS
jgi:hypothetical protein